MARKTSLLTTAIIALAGLALLVAFGLNEVTAYKADIKGQPQQATVISAVTNAPAVKKAANIPDQAVWAGQAKISVPVEAKVSPKISFSNGYQIDAIAGEPKLPEDLKYGQPKADETTYYIVQFNGPIQESWRKDLEAEGAEIMFYLPDYAFVVRMKESTRAKLVNTKGNISYTGLFQPAYKISDRAQARASNAKGGTFRATILVFSPEDIDVTVSQVEAIVGHKIFMKSSVEWAPGKWNKKIFVDVTKDQMTSLANAKGIYWIEPMNKFKTQNYNSQPCMQSGVIPGAYRGIWARGILGQGQIVQDLDTGIRESQNFFDDNARHYTTWYWDTNHRKVVGNRPGAWAYETGGDWYHGSMSKFGDEALNSYHGSHTAGSIAGDDSSEGGTYGMDGIARMARLLFIDGGGDSGSVYGTADCNIVGSWGWDSTVANGVPRAYISSNSWGDSSVNGAYDGSAMECDMFTWSHQDFLFIISDGNDGGVAAPGYKCGSPATNKNGMAIAALAAAGANGVGGANTKASFSSWGSHTDGRINPFVSAPGTAILSADGAVDNGTLSMQGTSMACPITAGTTALVRQYFTEGWYPTGTKVAADAFIPSGALMKAVVAISADSTTASHGSFTLDSLFGWGRPNLDTALFFSGDQVKMLLQDNRVGVSTGEAMEYQVAIPAGATNLKISLAWSDYPGSTTATYAIVNNLDLDAYEPTGATTPRRFRGNRFQTYATAAKQSDSLATTNDFVNVMEGIKVKAPKTGTWKIRVTGTNVVMGPQPFAIVVTYRTPLAAATGKVYLNKPVYVIPSAAGSIDTLKIEVDDFDKTGNCTVFVWSKRSEPKQGTSYPETLICALVGTGLYRTTVPLVNGNMTLNNDQLTCDQNDTIYVVYNDVTPTPDYPDTAKAVTDADMMTITNVSATDMVPPVGTQKKILWTTSRNATNKVYYGLTTALGSVASADTPLVVDHQFPITGLVQNQVYYYDVESKDARGVTVRDDNGGRHYAFSTGSGSGQSDVLVIVWDDDGYANSFVHGPYLTDALNKGGWTYDWWSTQLQGIVTTTQLKKYKAVYIQVAQDGPTGGNYPAFRSPQRDTLILYHNAGARFAVVGNDLGWDTYANATTVKLAAERQADTIFCRNYLHFTYKGDIASANTLLTDQVFGMTGDPISGSYTAGVSHSSWRTGAAGDSIVTSVGLPGYTGAAGTGSAVWHFESAYDSAATKWESAATMGTLGNGVWGGRTTRTIMNAFEITQLDTVNPASATRVDILNKMFIWLIGHDHPYDTIQTPVAGTTYTTSPISIAWRSYAKGGATIDTTWVEYSSNGGASWNTLVKGTSVTSPYSWDITTRENGVQYQVRVRVQDTGIYPAMSGSDTVGNFTLSRVGGDFTGPIIKPGTIRFSRNPVGNTSGWVLNVAAMASDSTTGLSNIQAVRCSVVASGVTYANVLMSATDGSFNAIQEAVNTNISTLGWPAGTYTVYVRAQDASPSKSKSANNWGVLSSATVLQVVDLLPPDGGAVTLSMFTASTGKPGVVLYWQTASEDNSYKWIIERCPTPDGNYEVVADNIEAAGNSNQAKEYTYTDLSAQPNQGYYYMLVQVDNDGSTTKYGPMSAKAGGLPAPEFFALQEARPNPFGGKVALSYQVPERSQVSLKIYNIAGQVVRTLTEGVKEAGYYQISWNGTGDNSKALSNGIYIYRLTATTASGQQHQMARKVTLLK
ncbi:S8 family serine peptidase [candidate division TA06 bacterium]|nr:S8 family serine peptidase [candidate division TA06 bacterium]